MHGSVRDCRGEDKGTGRRMDKEDGRVLSLRK